MTNTSIGRIAGTSTVVRVDYGTAIQAADELIRPPEVDALPFYWLYRRAG